MVKQSDYRLSQPFGILEYFYSVFQNRGPEKGVRYSEFWKNRVIETKMYRFEWNLIPCQRICLVFRNYGPTESDVKYIHG